MSIRDNLVYELSETMRKLEELNSADVTLNETSVLNCGLMVKYWSLKLQIAEEDCTSESDKLRVRAEHMIETSSRQMAEWEKRKASAWEKRKLDEIPRLAKAIQQIQNASSDLEGLD